MFYLPDIGNLSWLRSGTVDATAQQQRALWKRYRVCFRYFLVTVSRTSGDDARVCDLVLILEDDAYIYKCAVSIPDRNFVDATATSLFNPCS